jgi:hypothetical protein
MVLAGVALIFISTHLNGGYVKANCTQPFQSLSPVGLTGANQRYQKKKTGANQQT